MVKMMFGSKSINVYHVEDLGYYVKLHGQYKLL